MDPLQALLSGAGFLPHGYCIAWAAPLLWLHAGSDVLIGLAYASIPVALLLLLRRRPDLPFRWIYAGFAAFILACGLTHLVGALTLWVPTHWLAGLIKGVTATLSAVTAVALVKAMPVALALPAPGRLRVEVQERLKVEGELQRLNDDLEVRVRARTAELEAANADLRREVQERKRVEAALRESEVKFATVFRTCPEAISITTQKRQEDQLRLAARVFESTAEGILITDPAERIVAVNGAFVELTGYTEDELRGQRPSVLSAEPHQHTFAQIWDEVHRSGRWHGELWNRNKSGEVRPGLMTVSALRDDHGAVINYVGVLRDISSIKQSQQQLEYLANYDALTGLGNRNLFLNRLKGGIEKAARHRHSLALIFIDLDNFKVINDTQGHDVGDLLLSEVARRLKACVRQEDLVCRLGGDEFTVYLEDISDAQLLVGTAQRLVDTMAEPYRISGHDMFVTGSLGISIYPNDGKTISELVKNADTAMYKVKEQGRNGFQFFREDMNARAFERLVFVSGLRRALDRSEFRLAYQPQVALDSGRTRGAECLLRWNHPDLGEVSPGSFIPVAEDTGLIVPIGEWVFAQVCEQLRDWRGLRGPGRVSVNVSARQFRQPELIDMIHRLVTRAGVSPTRLGVEITESALVDDPDKAAVTLHRLKDMGLTIAIDDFGTGYSSLSYLKRFPIDSLKIDRTFVRDLAADPDDAAIVTAIITMAHSLKLEVIAEGVETEEQCDFLRARGCSAAQGYYFARPLPPDEAGQWLARE